jgi:hypothetical protein
VYVNGTLKTVDSDYTVSGVGSDSGGTVTFATAPASGQRVILLREVPLTQSTTYTNAGKFPAASHEATLDKLTMAIQQLKERLDRAPVMAPTNSVGLTPLAMPASAPSSYIRWNSAGTALENAAVLTDTQTIPIPLPTTQGGTGLNTSPATGDFLIGNSLGGYTLSNATTARTSLGAIGQSLLSARGSLIVASGVGSPANLAVGGNGAMLRSTAGAVTGMEWGAPAGYKWGLTLSNNVASAATAVDIALGEAASSSTTHANRVILALTSGLTKRLDTTWAAGTLNGGRASSATLTNTTYHVCLMRVGGVDDVGFDTSATCANLVTDHSASHVRRIGSVLRESGSLVSFTQYGREFLRTIPKSDYVVTNPGTSATTRTLSVPTGIKVKALHTAFLYEGTSDTTALFMSPDQTATAPSITLFDLYEISSVPGPQSVRLQIRTGTPGTITTRLSYSDANTDLRGVTHGWIDDMGIEQ